MKIVALVVLLILLAAVPAAAAAGNPGAGQPPPPASIANPPAIAPGRAVAWLNGISGRAALDAQAEALPVAIMALMVAGLLLMVGWLFGFRPAALVGQWLAGGVLLGYFLVMAAPRLVAALEGLVSR